MKLLTFFSWFGSWKWGCCDDAEMPCYRSGRDLALAAVGVEGDVGELRLGHLDHQRIGGMALGIHLDVDGHRGAADLDHLGVEGQHVADRHRLLEEELVHRDGGDAAARAADGGDAAGQVDVGHDVAAEDVAGVVHVGRHRHHAQRGLLVGKSRRIVAHRLVLVGRPSGRLQPQLSG
jgi:hypothetical protein